MRADPQTNTSNLSDIAALDTWLRAAVFVAIGATLLLAQYLVPRRPRRPLPQVWTNAALFLTNLLVGRALSAVSLVSASMFVSNHRIGLLNAIDLPPWLEGSVAVVALDFAVYLQHRLFHANALLWRLHSVHHADAFFDVWTGIRFHPGEMIVSLAFKMLAVVALGASPWSVLVFEALLSSAALFSHANIALPVRVDRMLRTCLITPDMHRIHHSTRPAEHNSNFGFLISCWDRWLGLYLADPDEPHAQLRIGLEAFRGANDQTYAALLTAPFQTRRFG